MLKQTPLHSIHCNLGARMVGFGGWDMPVQYAGIIEEHKAVRETAGLFDISHMGEIEVSGSQAGDFLNRTLTNDIAKLTIGLGQYTQLCNEKGGVLDDLYIYRIAEDRFLLVVNASRIDDDWIWIRKQHTSFGGHAKVAVENRSDTLAAVAVQGPAVPAFIDECFTPGSLGGAAVENPSALKKNELASFRFPGTAAFAWVSRTGYTGEDGFEIVAPAVDISFIWNALTKAGQPHGLQPAGLGARDTLRTEMCYPLYGHELGPDITPIEAGIGWSVALDKGDFTGREPIAQQKTHGVQRRLIAFRMTGKSAPPRPDYSIWSTGKDAREIGRITSGTRSPSLETGIGLGFVPPEFAKKQTPIEIEIRGRRFPAAVSAKPLYRKS